MWRARVLPVEEERAAVKQKAERDQPIYVQQQQEMKIEFLRAQAKF